MVVCVLPLAYLKGINKLSNKTKQAKHKTCKKNVISPLNLKFTEIKGKYRHSKSQMQNWSKLCSFLLAA